MVSTSVATGDRAASVDVVFSLNVTESLIDISITLFGVGKAFISLYIHYNRCGVMSF